MYPKFLRKYLKLQYPLLGFQQEEEATAIKLFYNTTFFIVLSPGRKGTLAVYYTSSQSFMIISLFVCLTTLGPLIEFLIGWFIKLSVQKFQPLILIYRRRSFVYQHLSCTSIYRPLSYHFRSLYFSDFNNNYRNAMIVKFYFSCQT